MKLPEKIEIFWEIFLENRKFLDMGPRPPQISNQIDAAVSSDVVFDSSGLVVLYK